MTDIPIGTIDTPTGTLADDIDPAEFFDPEEFGFRRRDLQTIVSMNGGRVPILRQELGRAGFENLPAIIDRAGEAAA